MLRPHTLTVLMTNRCTAKCDHCCMNSAPDRSERLDFPTIQKTVDELNEIQPLLTVVFAGGEPTLVKSVLRQAVRYCSQMGIMTRLVTNVSWAKTYPIARLVLEGFRKAGLHELNISADDYHLPFISFDNVVNAWHASKGLGFESVIIANSAGPNSRITPEFIMERIGERIPLRFDSNGNDQTFVIPSDDGTYFALSNSKLQRLERGSDLMPETDFNLSEDHSNLKAPCPFAIQNAALSPLGHLLACCGFEADGNEVLDFGNIRMISASHLVESANDDVIINAIAYLGPLFLKRFVEKVAPDVTFPDKFGSVCEVCRSVTKNPEAVKVLREHVADFGPTVIRRRLKSAQESEEAA